MSLPSFSNLLWAAGETLLFLACVLAVRRGLFARLPVFSTYMLLSLVRDVAWWLVLQRHDLSSPFAINAYWFMQGLLMISRGLAIVEICIRALGQNRGVWSMWLRMLLVSVVVLVVGILATLPGETHPSFFLILASERGFELIAVSVLVALLAVCRYYLIRIESPLPLVILGLGIYSGVQVANYSFLRTILWPYETYWDGIRSLSFFIAEALWFIALLKPLPERVPAPEMLGPSVYDQLVPEVGKEMESINERLKRLLK